MHVIRLHCSVRERSDRSALQPHPDYNVADLPHSRCNTTKIDDSQIERTFVTGFTSPASRTSLQDVSRRTSSYPRRSATMEAGATSDCKAVSLRKDSVSATVSQDGNVPVRRASSSSATSHDASLYAGAVEDFARGFFPPSRQMSAASETICESPTQVMPGEVPDETCGEGCRVDPDFKGPVVVRRTYMFSSRLKS